MIARNEKEVGSSQVYIAKTLLSDKKIYRGFSLVGRTWQKRDAYGGSRTFRKQMKSTRNNDGRIGEHYIRHRNYKLSLKIMRDKCVKRFYVCAYFAILPCDTIRYY